MAALFAALACRGPEPPYAQFRAPSTRFLDADDAWGMAGAYDASRLTVRGDTVVVWMRFQFSEPHLFLADPSRGRIVSITEIQQAVRCARGLARDVRVLVRNAAGDSLDGYTMASVRWESFAEHDLDQGTLVRLCRALPK